MKTANSVVAVFGDHRTADAALRKLMAAGFGMKSLSIVGKGYHTEEKVVGFYNIGDRMKFWGVRGAFWGGLWGLFLGGLFVTVPAVGPVVVLGHLAAIAISAVESAAIVGGLSVIGAAYANMGIPDDSIIRYETAVKADGFLVMAHGTTEEVERAKAILGAANPSRLDAHAAAKSAVSGSHRIHAGG